MKYKNYYKFAKYLCAAFGFVFFYFLAKQKLFISFSIEKNKTVYGLSF